MARISVPAVAAAAVLALAACSSMDTASPSRAGPGAVIDYTSFPPSPPLQARAPAGPLAGKDIARELADLRALLRQLSADIDESQRHLVELRGELERTRGRIDLLVSGQAGIQAERLAAIAGVVESRRPLVRIHFDHNGVEYADTLREAVEAALARLPDANFDVVAVAPAAGSVDPAGATGDAMQVHAEDVMATLLAMGIEPDRLSLSAATSEGAEVHLYIR